jgi:hypothetical protein
MNRLLALIILTIFVSCDNKTENEKADSKKQESKTSFLDQGRIDHYFSEYEIKPSVETNNNEGGTETEIQLLKHKIKWLDADDETKIKIDNDLFALKDKATLNLVWDNHDSVDFSNNWDEMKLYKINGRELIGIRMSFQPCTGLGCGVDYFLIYDVQTKAKNFFGTFRTDNKLALYNFNNDDRIDYVSKTFSGDAQGATPMEFIYELYSMDPNGHFVLQKDSSGQTYQIKQTTFPNDSTKTETFEQRWLTEIK